MDTNSGKILEALPNFTDILKLIEEIKEKSFRKMSVESEIKAKEAENFLEVMQNSEYFVQGKPVAVSYFENAYKYSGIKGNLLDLRSELAQLTSELEVLRGRHELYKQMQDLYKSVVFAERSVQ
jgi:hypothetical protein